MEFPITMAGQRRVKHLCMLLVSVLELCLVFFQDKCVQTSKPMQCKITGVNDPFVSALVITVGFVILGI